MGTFKYLWGKGQMYSSYSQMAQKKSPGYQCVCVCVHVHTEKEIERKDGREKMKKLMGKNANREFLGEVIWVFFVFAVFLEI